MAILPLTLKLLSPEGILLEVENLDSINVPLVDGGSIGIKPGHAPLIAETTQGTLYYTQAGEEHQLALHAGVLDIQQNTVTILTAGQLVVSPEPAMAAPIAEFDRLIQTLIENLYPEDENQETIVDD